MPTLRITVVDPPREFGEMKEIRLLLLDGEAHVPPVVTEGGDLVFEVPFTMRADRSGVLQPSGPCVRREGDGRRFVYLGWLGTENGVPKMFRRVKVQFDRVPGFPGDAETYSAWLDGTDKRGGPVCATVTLRDRP